MKKLTDLTDKEYNKLNKAGMLYVLYPDAIGDYEIDVKDSCGESPIFKIGDWFADEEDVSCARISHYEDNRCYFEGYYCGKWQSNWMLDENLMKHYRLATPEEIESHLIKEAKKRYPIGTKFYSARSNEKGIYVINNNEFHVNREELLANSEWGTTLYKDGKWAEIIKEEEIKIGEYKVEIQKEYIKVGCKLIRKDVFKSLYVIAQYCDDERCNITTSEEGLIHFNEEYGSRNNVQFSLNTLNKIINKLK